MTAWEVILLVAGFACLCISVLIMRKNDDQEPEEGERQSSSAVWTEKEEQMIRERVEELLQETQNDLMDRTEEEMGRLCNDKIMAIDEFSRQLLEKIENNHQEVVFMYNMLNEKEKEVTKLVTEPVVRKIAEKEEAKPAVVEKKAETPKRPGVEPKQQAVPVPKKPAAVPTPAGSATKKEPVPPASDRSGEISQQIQKMYREGKSVLEISKALNIGRGEVNLVIALYGGKGR